MEPDSVLAGEERQTEVFGGGGAAARSFFEGGVAAMGRIVGLLAVENLLDGEDLQAGLGAAVGGFVEAGFGGFAEHGFGRFLETEKDADLGLLALKDAAQVADLGDGDAASFDGKDDLLGFAGVVVVEVEAAVDAAVCAFLLICGPRADLAERPPLELVFVFGGQLRRACVVRGFADDLVGGFDLGAEGVGEALLDEADGEVGDVDADPAAVEALRDLDGGAAAAEGVEDEVALVGTGFDDAFEKGFGFLSGVAEALLGLCVDWPNVRPDVLYGYAFAFRPGSACTCGTESGFRAARFCPSSSSLRILSWLNRQNRVTPMNLKARVPFRRSSWAGEIAKRVTSPGFFFFIFIEIVHVTFVVLSEDLVPWPVRPFRIEEDDVMDTAVLLSPLLAVAMRAASLPDDLSYGRTAVRTPHPSGFSGSGWRWGRSGGRWSRFA